MQQRRRIVALAVAGIVSGALANQAQAGMPEAQKWVDSEFQPSTLSKQQQMDEMKWFVDTSAKLKSQGVKEIHVVSETIDTHIYESKTLAKAFTEITGIQVKHDIIQEGDVVEKLQTSMQSGQSIYDGWISDSDLIGTHYRYGVIVPLSDYMTGEGKEYTNPASTSKTSSARVLRPRRTRSSINCPTSSSPTFTGSAPTGSRARTCRTSSRRSTATSWACR